MKHISYLFPVESAKRKSNTSFISDRCEVCGRTNEPCLSELIFKAGYGSTKYDGEMLTLNVCGDCIDKAFDYMLHTEKRGAVFE